MAKPTIAQLLEQLAISEARETALEERAVTAESALAAMPTPIADADKKGWYRAHIDWTGSALVPASEDVAVLLVPNMSFNKQTKPLSGLLADYTKGTNDPTTELDFATSVEELVNGLVVRIDKAEFLSTGEVDPDDLSSHAPDFRKDKGNAGGFKSTGTISMAN
jgi:hypothetical protein